MDIKNPPMTSHDPNITNIESVDIWKLPDSWRYPDGWSTVNIIVSFMENPANLEKKDGGGIT